MAYNSSEWQWFELTSRALGAEHPTTTYIKAITPGRAKEILLAKAPDGE